MNKNMENGGQIISPKKSDLFDTVLAHSQIKLSFKIPHGAYCQRVNLCLTDVFF